MIGYFSMNLIKVREFLWPFMVRYHLQRVLEKLQGTVIQVEDLIGLLVCWVMVCWCWIHNVWWVSIYSLGPCWWFLEWIREEDNFSSWRYLLANEPSSDILLCFREDLNFVIFSGYVWVGIVYRCFPCHCRINLRKFMPINYF